MNRLIIGVAASAISALLCSASYLGAQQTAGTPAGGGHTWIGNDSIRAITTSGGSYAVNTAGQIVFLDQASQRPALPQGSAYHQVVDIYYDGDGNKLDAKSYTHRIDYDCNRNLRRQDENLMVQDDGKGNVRFVQTRLPSEPLLGLKPVSPEGIVKAQLAAKRSPQYIDPPPLASTPQLASKE